MFKTITYAFLTQYFKYKKSLNIPIKFVLFLWIIQIINSTFFNQSLLQYGIIPRENSHLLGILFAPFLHANYTHLINNTFFVFVLTWILCYYNTSIWWLSTITITILGGIIIWFVGGNNIHVGSSILIFGYFGVIFGTAWNHKKPYFIIASIIIVLLYGMSIINGFIPEKDISLSGHIGGFFSGFLISKLFSYDLE